MKRIKDIFKNNPLDSHSHKIQLLWIYAIATIVALWMYADISVAYSNDSPHYMSAGETFLSGRLHNFRTPLYPLIYHFAKVVAGGAAGHIVVILQILLFMLSILAFYRSCCFLVQSRKIVFIASLLYAIHPGIILWNQFIITESFAISGAVILFYFVVEFYKKQRVWSAVAIPVTILALIALRPSSIYFTPALALFTLYMLVKRRKYAWTLFSGLIISAIAVAGYCFKFYQEYGIFSPSNVSILNQYYFLRKSNLLKVDDATSDNMKIFIADILSEEEGTETMDQFEEFTFLVERFGHRETNKMIKNAIGREQSRYSGFIIQQIMDVRNFPAFSHFVNMETVSLPGKIYIKACFFLLAFPFHLVYLFLAAYAIVLYFYSRKKRHSTLIHWFILLTVGSNLMLILIGAVSEWHRLFVPSMPLLFIMMASVADKLRIKGSTTV